MIRKIVFILLSIFLAFKSWEMLNGIVGQKPIDVPLLAFVFSFLIALFITGVFAFAGFALPTQKLMPDRYYLIKNRQLLNLWYSRLKVDLFKKYLIKFIWGKPKKKKEYFSGKRKGIDDFIINTKKSEFGHLIPFIIILAVTVYVFIFGKYYLAAGLLFFNVLGNLYPIILQRHHRARLEKMGLYKKKN